MTPEEGTRAEECNLPTHPLHVDPSPLAQHKHSRTSTEQSIPADQPHNPDNAQEQVRRKDYKEPNKNTVMPFPIYHLGFLPSAT